MNFIEYNFAFTFIKDVFRLVLLFVELSDFDATNFKIISISVNNKK